VSYRNCKTKKILSHKTQNKQITKMASSQLNTFCHVSASSIQVDDKKHEQYLKELAQALQTIQTLASSDEWVLDTKTSDIHNTVMYGHPKESIPTFKVTGQLHNTTVDKVLELQFNVDNTFKLSENTAELDVLFTCEDTSRNSLFETTQLVYNALRTPTFLVSPRDQLLFRGYTSVGDKKYIVTSSVTHEGVQERNKYVRSHLSYSGYIFEPNADGKENVVDVTYIIQLDGRGSVPTWLVKLANKSLLHKLTLLQKHL
jgi:hypothetical protein